MLCHLYYRIKITIWYIYKRLASTGYGKQRYLKPVCTESSLFTIIQLLSYKNMHLVLRVTF